MNPVTVSILALLSFGAATVENEFDPCSLLTDSEIQAVQGHAPAQKVASEQPSASFRFAQCFYRTPEHTNSVSVAVGLPLATDSQRSGPRQYWRQQFHPQAKPAAGRKKKPPPKPIAGLGDEAFWVGDPLSGALYVLKGEVFVRVSVGGPTDEAQKIKRARTLASRVLTRLNASAPRPRS